MDPWISTFLYQKYSYMLTHCRDLHKLKPKEIHPYSDICSNNSCNNLCIPLCALYSCNDWYHNLLWNDKSMFSEWFWWIFKKMLKSVPVYLIPCFRLVPIVLATRFKARIQTSDMLPKKPILHIKLAKFDILGKGSKIRITPTLEIKQRWAIRGSLRG